MCELLAMSSRLPATVNFSWRELSRHGGETGPHRDGWGIAYVMGRDFRIIKEPVAAAESDCVCYLHAHHCVSHIVISHIRRASLPKMITFENTHPFDRELFGRRFVFAHNGDLPGVDRLASVAPRRFMPLGETDSEQAFCLMLNLLAERSGMNGPYNPQMLVAVLRELNPQLLALGHCNYLLSDGQWLIAHGDNSLYCLTRTCDAETNRFEDGKLRMQMEHPALQRVSLVATVPLTDDEDWRRFERGELRVFHAGEKLPG